jgi:hypothetical protein
MLQGIVKNLSIDNFRITNSARRRAVVTDGIRFFLIATKKLPELHLKVEQTLFFHAVCNYLFPNWATVSFSELTKEQRSQNTRTESDISLF